VEGQLKPAKVADAKKRKAKSLISMENLTASSEEEEEYYVTFAKFKLCNKLAK
jgi:hypothetical protein